jgi:hypothetical protein
MTQDTGQSVALPAGFEELEPLLDWNLDTMAERRDRRMQATMEELDSFYQALLPHMDAVLEHLAGVDMSAPIDDGSQALLNLSKSLAEVAPAVEQFFEPTISYGYQMDRFTVGPE